MMVAMTRLGKYEIRRELGKGAMGVVYEGFDPLIERTVAIKTILPAQLNSAEAAEVLARFKREAQAAGRLNHPNIVAVYDYGEVVAENDHTMMAAPSSAAPAERVAYIAMEFVKGKELRDYFEANERFALPEVARLMGEMLDALAHAHECGVVHRDMKPANLILLASGKLKVADFGIARIEASQLTQAGTVMGTPSYMSPEQFQGLTVDGRSDIFSCGVILYQFLTGEKPFTGSTTTIMYKVLQEEPAPPSALNRSLPPGLDAVISKALAKNPANRYQSAGEFKQALAQAISAVPTAPAPIPVGADDPTIARLPKPALPQPAAAPQFAAAPQPAQPLPQAFAAPAQPSPVQPASAAVRSRAPVLAAVAVAVLMLLGAGAYVLLGKSSAPATLAQAPSTAVASAGSAALPVPASSAAVVAAAPVVPVAASADPLPEPGTLILSAVSVVNPQDPRFKGDAALAQAELRADAQRQLVQKALALYVDSASLGSNQALIDSKLMPGAGSYIKTVLRESNATSGGLLEAESRAVVKVREVQKSLNQLSRDERVEFIRKQGDPKVALQMQIRSEGSAQQLAPERSQLAENVLKQRIKSFGFRVWSEGDAKLGDKAQSADFVVQGEVRLKQLSTKLAASGLTITKSVLTSWTVKAIDKATGEEIYLNTVLPKNQSWASEEQALADIGKQVGDEFSKNFFLQHFAYDTQKTNLRINGLPDVTMAQLLLRELRGSRQVLDVQAAAIPGEFTLQLAAGSVPDIVQAALVTPLNAKLGQACLALTGAGQTSAGGAEVNLSFAAACGSADMRTKLESLPPAGVQMGRAGKIST